MSQNQNGISIRFSSRNSSKKFSIELPPQSVTGATALAIRLEQLVARRGRQLQAGAGVEEQPAATGSPAVNGICKLSPEDKLKRVRDALNESY